ncbi:MAG: UvrD-helicase domain-containing protein [Flavobacteriaceae bacterium]|nr:UvrD-helicase domain-containing protein [Flavobacteriaceae bacterium]
MNNTSSFQIYNASAGSGKTFTLVKEYLKILLKSENMFVFQNILAITFTNKASEEMKERILGTLHEFSDKSVLNNTPDMLHLLSEETGISVPNIHNKSIKLRNAIIKNYSSFNIITIDSFTQKLVRGFAFDLGLSNNFEVELDVSTIKAKAVDMLMSEIGVDKKITDLLVSYAIDMIQDDRAWDVQRELFNFSSVLFSEDNIKYVEELKNVSLDDFEKIGIELKSQLDQINKEFSKFGNSGLDIIGDIDHKSFSYSDLPKYFIKLVNFKTLLDKNIKYEGSRLNKNIENDAFYSKSKSAQIKADIDAVSEELSELYSDSKAYHESVIGKYFLYELCRKSFLSLSLLSSVQKEIDKIKKDNNIQLISDFNSIINNNIKDEPVPFIYEKIGERYQYFFIDEMQDTSTLQWQNLVPLIANALSKEDGGLMIVGDAKQSIYRWRGGKTEQFIELYSQGDTKDNNPFYIDKKVENLDTNYRSYSEIIKFTNSFFKHISGFLEVDKYEELYKIGNNQKENSKKGGFVQLSFVDKQDYEDIDLAFPEKVLSIVNNLDNQYDRNEICILCRTKKQAVDIANHLIDNDVDIISSETLLLNNNKVRFVMDLLKVIDRPDDKESIVNILYFICCFLKKNKKNHDFIIKNINLELYDILNNLNSYGFNFDINEFEKYTFYESIEYIIRSFGLVDTSDLYLQMFLDFVFEFQSKKQEGLQGFLEYWDIHKDKISVVATENKNAVRIMTIHKAKGLEFPVVISPYDLDIFRAIDPKVWLDISDKKELSPLENILIPLQKKIIDTGGKGAELYENHQNEMQLDNFNLLYVALTRAVERLYIVSELKLDKDNKENTNYYSGLFVDYLKQNKLWNEEVLDYEFGNKQRVSVKKTNNNNNNIEPKEYFSSHWSDRNVNMSFTQVDDIDRDYSIKYGSVVHEILENIISKEDVDNAVRLKLKEIKALNIETNNIRESVLNIINNDRLKPYYEKGLKVYNERSIYSELEVIIPDRLVFDTDNSVVIIDYKTGNKNKSHISQINNYEKVLKSMGYEVKEKLLIYLSEQDVVVHKVE